MEWSIYTLNVDVERVTTLASDDMDMLLDHPLCGDRHSDAWHNAELIVHEPRGGIGGGPWLVNGLSGLVVRGSEPSRSLELVPEDTAGCLLHPVVVVDEVRDSRYDALLVDPECFLEDVPGFTCSYAFGVGIISSSSVDPGLLQSGLYHFSAAQDLVSLFIVERSDALTVLRATLDGAGISCDLVCSNHRPRGTFSLGSLS